MKSLIDVKAYWVSLGPAKEPVANALLILDIKCWGFKRSICFHIHLKDILMDKKKNGMIIEHVWGPPNMSGYQSSEFEVKETY